MSSPFRNPLFFLINTTNTLLLTMNVIFILRMLRQSYSSNRFSCLWYFLWRILVMRTRHNGSVFTKSAWLVHLNWVVIKLLRFLVLFYFWVIFFVFRIWLVFCCKSGLFPLFLNIWLNFRLWLSLFHLILPKFIDILLKYS